MYAIPLEINRIQGIMLLLAKANHNGREISFATGKGKPDHESIEQAMVFPGVPQGSAESAFPESG